MKIIVAAISLMLSFSALAEFGEKVNCKTVTTGEQAIYEGWANCRSTVNFHDYVWRYYPASPSHLRTDWFHSDGRFVSCHAYVPLSHYEPLAKKECDYKPVASVWVYPDEGTTSSQVGANAKDFDGTITKIEMFVDGVKVSGNMKWLHGNAGDTFNVRVIATDNDGYTHTKTRTVTLKYRPPARCGEYLC
tara:strand:+ start:445 stop:1014 length:570 start_codon:yes stop_codon:yes gene_type:complete